jgi:hypothetical protein
LSTQQDLAGIQKTAQKLDANQVARFSYTEAALAAEKVDGVEAFDAAADQNVPAKGFTDYDPMVLDKGVRAQGASIPRLGLNHFFGRTSFNLNLLIRKLTLFFGIHRRALAHNANEYDPQAEYATGDVCYIVEIEANARLYSWFQRVSASPLYIVNVSPLVSTTDWKPVNEATAARLLSNDTPLMDGAGSPGNSAEASRSKHVHPTDTSRAPNAITLYEEDAADALPPSGTVTAILQAIRNCLKWLKTAVTSNSGITQLTGDVTAPATVNGPAVATLAASGVTAGAYGDGGATRTLGFGGAFKVLKTFTVDAKGRVTAAEAITLALPANPDTDNRGITQLTGDVTAPSTVSGSAAATIKPSVGLTGAPTAPTAPVNAKTQQLANTEFVRNQLEEERGYVPVADPGALAGYGRVWTNAEGLLVVNDHLVEWGRKIDLNDVFFFVSGGQTLTMAVEVSGIYRYVVAGGKGGKGAASNGGLNIGGNGGAGYVNEGVVSLTATQTVRLTSGAVGAGGGTPSLGGLVIAGMGYSGYTEDGTTWRAGDLLLTSPITDLAECNGLFVGVRYDGYAAVSSDGVAWGSAYASIAYNITSGNGMFVGAGSNNHMVVSTDGVEWTMTSPDSHGGRQTVCYGAGVFVLLTEGGVSSSMTASVTKDAVLWTKTTVTSSNYASNMQDAVYGNGVFIFITSNAAYSITRLSVRADALTVSSTVVSMSAFKSTAVSIAFGNGVFVIVYANGDTASSASGSSWTRGQLPVLGATADILWNKVTFWNGRFIAIGTEGKIASSLDGLTWQMESSPTTANLTAIVGRQATKGGGSKGGLSRLENLSTGTTIATSLGGAGGGGAYNDPNVGGAGEAASDSILGGSGGVSGHVNGYPGQGGTSQQADGYVQLAFQRPL